jgi:hypothetical protein
MCHVHSCVTYCHIAAVTAACDLVGLSGCTVIYLLLCRLIHGTLIIVQAMWDDCAASAALTSALAPRKPINVINERSPDSRHASNVQGKAPMLCSAQGDMTTAWWQQACEGEHGNQLAMTNMLFNTRSTVCCLEFAGLWQNPSLRWSWQLTAYYCYMTSTVLALASAL